MLIERCLDGPFPSLSRNSERQDGVWHPSTINACLPKMLLDYYGIDIWPKDLGLLMTVATHDAVRDHVAEYLRAEGLHPAVEFAVSDEDLNLSGHIDVLWDGGLCDIKTLNQWGYERYVKDSTAGYWWDQLECYLRMSQTEQGWAILVDRSAGPGLGRYIVYEHRQSDERWSRVLARLTFAQMAVDTDEMPDSRTIEEMSPAEDCSKCRLQNFCYGYSKVSEFIDAMSAI